MSATILILAKAPKPGLSKTRLCPPLTSGDAARVAEACLIDTLSAVAEVGARCVVALEGQPGAWLPRGFEIIPQRGRDLATRIAMAFEDVGEPAVLIGMDTPQVTPGLLRSAVRALEETDAVFGPAEDGGWWVIGLRRPDREVFAGVPMSTPWTGEVQHARLHEQGLSHRVLPTLRDVDDISDARSVAAGLPDSHLSFVLGLIEHGRLQPQDAAWRVGYR